MAIATPESPSPIGENLRGAGFMTLAMLAFATADMFIKMMGGALPGLEVVCLLSAGGAVVFGAIAAWQGQVLASRAFLEPAIVVRNVGELVGSLGFVSALVLMPISMVSAILQASPLLVALGAAVFFGEPVGWRRWSAIAAGFAGVLLIIRPGMEGFDSRSLLAVAGAVGLSVRDLATRRVPHSVSSVQLSFLALTLLVPTAILLAWLVGQSWVVPAPHLWGWLAGAVLCVVVAYYGIAAAMRAGDVSFVTAFRYTRIVFAVLIGVTLFGERLDAPMLAGTAIVVGSGLYTIYRESVRRVAA